MLRKQTRALALIAVTLLAATLGPLTKDRSPQAEAQRLQAEITSICTQIPNLTAAVDFSLRTWPPATTDDNLTALRYFMQLVRSDSEWCQSANTAQQPELINQTFRWHFGNASTQLQQYQEHARSATPAPPPAGPAARRSHSAVWDPVGTQMLVFGGFSSVTLGDLWSYRPATNAWAPLAQQSVWPAGRADHSAVWDPDSGLMLVFGGINGSGVLDGLWSYNALTNSWNSRDPSGSAPLARSDHGAVWDPQNHQMLVFGGCNSVLYCSNFLGDLWSYRPAGNAWTSLAPSGGGPSARSNPAMAWDSVNQQVLVFGGLSGSGFLNDLWAYRPAANAWVQLAPSGGRPAAREDQAVVWDSASNRMLLFGGRVDCCSRLNDLWSYSAATNAWSRVTPAGAAPSGRVEASAVWNPVNSQLLLFGGLSAAPLNELWRYQPADNVWTTITPTQ